MTTKLTSAQNPKIKRACSFRERRCREEESRTILEGYRELSRALEFGMKIEECYFCPSMFLGSNEDKLLRNLESSGAELFEVTPELLTKMAYRDRPEGLVGIAVMRKHSLDDMPFVEGGLYLVAESVEKPGNLGSMLRSADAAGASGVIICRKCTDIYNPNVIRASTGAIFAVPLAEANVGETFDWLGKNGVSIMAATPHSEKIFTDVDMKKSMAIVVGAEQYGLSEEWLSRAHDVVKIPMLGKIDSLNVALAASILLFEAARQRNWRKIS